uniref:Tetratricopeptide repeat protein 24-like isoform X5 n=1 Tax=Crassostrea virginica TaxID=6565 RepID=A0A8B8EHV7_CRAVI|nr:tetratricopeptide repeat protein 24-like isoform X5 [Crassostrea virginica]
MKMEHRMFNPAVEVEKFSKLGTQDLQNNHPERALESFKYAFKCSKELVDDGYTERACAFNLGAVYIALGNGKKGIEILNKALPPNNTREGRSNGDLFFNLGLGHETMGNSEEAVRNYKKALEEYKVERDNVQMEAETLEKLGQLYLKTKNKFAMDTFDQLAQTYEILNKPSKQLWALTEKTNQQFTNGLLEEAENSAEECLKLAEKCEPSVNIGTIYNDLGLIFTQRQKYDKAVSCFESALPMVEGADGDKKQMAVIFQNLGATFNFLGNYQKAVEYHEKASDMYARLRNRSSQGQCFANMAFAYSQLGDISNAGEAFLHAFQAAKDSGDKRTQWQVCEGLGAVSFNQNNIKKAVEYFQKALTLVASSEPLNTAAQNRIVAKITLAVQAQVKKESAPVVRKASPVVTKTVNRTPVKESFIKKEVATRVESTPITVGSASKHGRYSTSMNKTKHVSYGFVPVGRKGSSLRYEKVARGLSKDTINTDTFRSSTRSSMKDIESKEEESHSSSSYSSSSSSSSSEEEEEEGTENSDIDKTIHQTKMKGRESRASSSKSSIMNTTRRQSVKAAQVGGLHASSDNQESDEDTARKEEDEETAVKEEMKKQLRNNSDSDSETSPKSSRGKFKPKQTEENSDSESSDSEEEPPPLPTQSPPQTTKMAGTYETPQGVQEKRIQYARSRGTGGKQLVRHSKQSPHPNFLSDQIVSSSSSEESSDDNDEDEDGDQKQSLAKTSGSLEASGSYHEIEMGTLQGQGHIEEDDPLYQSIPPRRDTARTQNEQVDTPSFEKGPRFQNFSDLPRGVNSASFDNKLYRAITRYRF